MYSYAGLLLGYAQVNTGAKFLTGRLIVFGSDAPLQQLEQHVNTAALSIVKQNVLRAIRLRAALFPSATAIPHAHTSSGDSRPVQPYTNAYRLINSEGDALPGLIVDR